MEGWRQRRLAEKVRIHREEHKNVLTPTGLLMEGLEDYFRVARNQGAIGGIVSDF
jgi:hypothetical protein